MQQVAVPTITRRPEHDGHDDPATEDYLILIDGNQLGGTYHCPGPDGGRWASWGPAGLSMGHRGREDAERVQIAKQLRIRPADAPTVTTDILAAPAGSPTTPAAALPMTWEQALAEAERIGTSRCSDAAVMAQFCQGSIHILIGAVSPQLVWEGAQKKGLTFLEFGRLCGGDRRAVEALQWI